VIGDIARAAEGDRCHSCGAPLGFHAAVKLGSMWKSGNGAGGTERATFQDRDGTERPLFFGWHEIALDRLLAVIAEGHHDDHGLVWPVGVAPFDVHLVSLGTAGSAAARAAERLHDELENAGRDVLFDDRDERPGVKFADADLIGVQVRLTVSERSLQAGGVEMKLRNQESKEMIPHAEVIARVSEKLRF
jgi:prolyl-tRNA synthetase